MSDPTRENGVPIESRANKYVVDAATNFVNQFRKVDVMQGTRMIKDIVSIYLEPGQTASKKSLSYPSMTLAELKQKLYPNFTKEDLKNFILILDDKGEDISELITKESDAIINRLGDLADGLDVDEEFLDFDDEEDFEGYE